MKTAFHQSIHLGLILLTTWFVVLFLKNPSLLVKIYETGSFITKSISYIPYVRFSDHLTQSNNVITAYLVLLYLAIGIIYLNLYFAADPFGKKILAHKPAYERSAEYFILMAINVYNKCSPPLGLTGRKELTKFLAEPEKMVSIKFEDFLANQFDEDKLKKPFLAMTIVGYVVLPLFLYLDLLTEKISHGRYAFWSLAIVMTFVQIRVLTDTFIVFRAITIK